jgi:membrane associated rhomboid family serine protease
MAQCDACGKHENMPYNCRFCGGTYCSEHRLPENHACVGLKEWDDPGGVFDSGFDDSVDDRGRTSDGVLSRIGVETGPGGLLGYFRGNVTYLFLALMWLTFVSQLLVGELLGNRTMAYLFVLQSNEVLRVWTWVTSIFAHGGFGHIAINSIVLYFFGPVVERRVGSRKFAALFLIAGVAAGLAQVLAVAYFSPLPTGVVGASGAIAAIMGVLTVLNPNLRIYLYFILPMPLWLATFLFAGYSVFASSLGGWGAGGVAHLAHLAGLFIGLGYGEKLKREGQRAPQQLQFGGGPGGPGGGGRGPGRF